MNMLHISIHLRDAHTQDYKDLPIWLGRLLGSDVIAYPRTEYLVPMPWYLRGAVERQLKAALGNLNYVRVRMMKEHLERYRDFEADGAQIFTPLRSPRYHMRPPGMFTRMALAPKIKSGQLQTTSPLPGVRLMKRGSTRRLYGAIG